MNHLPCPRLELKWEPINERALDEVQSAVFEKNGMEVPYHDWRCDYVLVLPLREHDIRSVDGATELRLPISHAKRVKNGTSPVNSRGEVDTPMRDGVHIRWDNKALGGHLPMVAICGERVTVLTMDEGTGK